ncbi:MAG: 1,4-dihydroxy-2-naphthoyl-CoA synthase [Acidimicrobiales bacterium]|nr:MAG: 1,4-dihydroxy-6-naphthoate synthase [Actinomycetota bacterium]MBV6508048.1 1,4-dihydroxy-2-naphthoyl-CoA synthase [Acidimicrobiales bacterium]RIK05324.1 MAG: 1,4-dihydroxy-6-naphthoate synthase [Acidobacteriota bacterium]
MPADDSTFEDLLFDVTAGVATITINRPERRNALRLAGITEMCEALERANLDDSVGVVVVTGAGETAFCAGGDLQQVPGPDGESTLELPPPELGLRWVSAFRNCTKPVIAKVRGYCIGMGNELNLLCDLTLAGESARFGQAGPRVGSVPVIGGTQLLPLVCGLKRAKEIMFLCRQYSGRDAVEMGLANVVVPDEDLDDEVKRWCDELLELSPQSLRIAKLSLSYAFDQAWPAVLHGMELSRWFLRQGDMVEGAAAFLEKRKPDFRPGLEART